MSTQLSLEQATQQGAASIRVRYSSVPYSHKSTGAKDALNPRNYTVIGTSSHTVMGVFAVSADPYSFDIMLSSPVGAGLYTVSVENVETAAGAVVSATPVSFLGQETPAARRVGVLGTLDAESTIRSYISPEIKGTNVAALIAAIASGDTFNWENAKKAFRQLFVSTAEGKYLDAKAADSGEVRPKKVGMSDDLFRKLAIQTSSGKITTDSVMKVLEIFYGEDSVRAHATSSREGPYSIYHGDDLRFILDEKDEYVVIFDADDLSVEGQATSLEVCVAITGALRKAGARAYAKTTVTASGKTLPRVYSGSLGLRSSVRVTGGKAQNALVFESETSGAWGTFASTNWTVSTSTDGTVRYTNAANSGLDLSKVRVGDYVNIYGDFHLSNQGSFPVVKVYRKYIGPHYEQFFEVDNTTGVSETVTQLSQSSVRFFCANKNTIYAPDKRTVVLAQQGSSGLSISVPATTVAVTRNQNTGSYIRATDVDSIMFGYQGAVSGTRTATTATLTCPDHTFQAGDLVKVVSPDSEYPSGLYRLTATTTSTISYEDYAGGTSVASPPPTVHFVGGLLNPTNSLVRVRFDQEHALSDGSQVALSGLYAQNEAPGQKRPVNLGTPGNPGYSSLDWVASVSPLRDSGLSERRHPVAGVTSNGHYLIGGGDDGVNTFSDCKVLSHYADVDADGSTLVTYNWHPVASLPVAHGGMASTSLPDGRLLACGGWTAVGSGLGSTATYLFVAATGSWDTAASLQEARTEHTATTLANGNVVVIGGYETASIGTCEVFDGTSWSYTSTPLPTPRWGHSAILLDSGKVLVIGGAGDDGVFTETCLLFDPDTETFSQTGSMSRGREDFATIKLPDGKVLVSGGEGEMIGLGPNILKTCEIYDPSTGIWSTTGSMNSKRYRHSLALFSAPDNTSYKNGFVVASSHEGKSEVYDLATGRWSYVPGTIEPLNRYTSAVTGEGSRYAIFFGGGEDYNGAFVYTPNASATYSSSSPNGKGTVHEVIDTKTVDIRMDRHHSGFSIFDGGKIIRSRSLSAIGKGSYLLAPEGALTVAVGSSSTLVSAIAAGQSYSLLELADATAFPDSEGYLTIGLGTNGQTGPVRYLGKASSTSLILDYRHVFKDVFPAGSTVALLSSTPVPAGSGTYLTASNAGRQAALQAIDSMVAAGIPLDRTVVYPGDRGLAGEGLPSEGATKLSDKVSVWGSDSLAEEREKLRRGI